MVKTKEMNLKQKLLALKEKVPYIQKEKKEYIQFAVVSSENVLTAFQSGMNELKLLLKTEVMDKSIHREVIGTNQKTGKNIFNYLVVLDVRYTWINVENQEEQETIDFIAVADDENSSYAMGQALTYAEKTFFMKEFNIPTDDADPDVFQREILKRIPASPEQIESIRIQLNKLNELTGNPKDAFLEQAKMNHKINPEKLIEEFSGYDFGNVARTLNGWVNGYEKKQAKTKKQKKSDVNDKSEDCGETA